MNEMRKLINLMEAVATSNPIDELIGFATKEISDSPSVPTVQHLPELVHNYATSNSQFHDEAVKLGYPESKTSSLAPIREFLNAEFQKRFGKDMRSYTRDIHKAQEEKFKKEISPQDKKIMKILGDGFTATLRPRDFKDISFYFASPKKMVLKFIDNNFPAVTVGDKFIQVTDLGHLQYFKDWLIARGAKEISRPRRSKPNYSYYD